MKVLYFFPHAIYPTKTGAHVRAVQTLSSLSRLGIETHLATYKDSSYPWTESRRNTVRNFLCHSVSQFPHSRVGPNGPAKSTPIGSLFNRDESGFLPDYFGETSGPARKWIRDIITGRGIDTMFVTYPVYAGMVPQTGGVHRVMELFDMWTVNGALQSALQAGFDQPLSADKIPLISDSPVLDRTYLGGLKTQASPFETHIVTKFPSAIAISHHDEKMLRDLGTPNVERIPVMVTVPSGLSPCEGIPALALGPNLLNTQGLAHFCHRIVPRITATIPDFKCNLYGTVPLLERVRLGNSIVNRGFVPDFGAAMCASGFFINPVFSGTGMQIKTVESMAYGLAPVCYDNVAEDAGVRHLESGWVAGSEEEFAEGVIALSNDPALRKKLGRNAREHVRATMSESQLDSALGRFITRAMSMPTD